MQHPSTLYTCVYCGQPAQARDHVLPLSQADLALDNPQYARQLFTVSCCSRCNNLAHNKVFPSFIAKAHYLQSRRKSGIKWNTLMLTVPIVNEYLHQLDNGKSTAQLDAEYALINKKSPHFYFNRKPKTRKI